MKKLNPPVVDDRQHLDDCAARTQIPTKRALKEAHSANVATKFVDYLTKAATKEFFNIDPIFDDTQKNERKTFEENYDFMDEGRYLRSLYNTIKSLPKFGECPFCSALTVSSVDHYLPKAIYGEYSVFVPNLIAACDNCNEVSKRQHIPNCYEDQFYHPYFDDEPLEEFLVADVLIEQAVRLQYSISPPASWSFSETERARFNFKRLNLPQLYTAKAAQRLSNMKARLVKLLDEDGATAVEQHLREDLNSSENGDSGINGWETVMYRSLATSVPFCQGGLRLISL